MQKKLLATDLFLRIDYNTNNYYCAANIATNPLSKNNFNCVTSLAEKNTGSTEPNKHSNNKLIK